MCTVYHCVVISVWTVCDVYCVVISVWTVCDVYSVSLCSDISVDCV